MMHLWERDGGIGKGLFSVKFKTTSQILLHNEIYVAGCMCIFFYCANYVDDDLPDHTLCS